MDGGCRNCRRLSKESQSSFYWRTSPSKKMVQVQCGGWMFLGCCAVQLSGRELHYQDSLSTTTSAHVVCPVLFLCHIRAPLKANMWQHVTTVFHILPSHIPSWTSKDFFLPPRCSLSTRSFLLAWQKPRVCMGMILWAHLPQANMKHFGNSKVCLDAKGWRDGYQPYRRVPGGVLGSLGIVGLATESLRSSRARQGRLLHVHRARMIRLVAGQSEGSTSYSLYR